MSRQYCVAKGCGNKREDKEIPFFCLPKPKERRDKWADLIGRPDLKGDWVKPRNHYVCGLHFEKSMIYYRPQLKADALPTLASSTNNESESISADYYRNRQKTPREMSLNSVPAEDSYLKLLLEFQSGTKSNRRRDDSSSNRCDSQAKSIELSDQAEDTEIVLSEDEIEEPEIDIIPDEIEEPEIDIIPDEIEEPEIDTIPTYGGLINGKDEKEDLEIIINYEDFDNNKTVQNKDEATAVEMPPNYVDSYLNFLSTAKDDRRNVSISGNRNTGNRAKTKEREMSPIEDPYVTFLSAVKIEDPITIDDDVVENSKQISTTPSCSNSSTSKHKLSEVFEVFEHKRKPP